MRRFELPDADADGPAGPAAAIAVLKWTAGAAVYDCRARPDSALGYVRWAH